MLPLACIFNAFQRFAQKKLKMRRTAPISTLFSDTIDVIIMHPGFFIPLSNQILSDSPLMSSSYSLLDCSLNHHIRTCNCFPECLPTDMCDIVDYVFQRQAVDNLPAMLRSRLKFTSMLGARHSNRGSLAQILRSIKQMHWCRRD